MKACMLLILILTSFNVFSQDIITTKRGEDIEAKVLEVDQTVVKYKKYDFQDGPTYTISKNELLIIRYQNGTKDIFVDSEPSVNQRNVSNSVVIPAQAVQHTPSSSPISSLNQSFEPMEMYRKGALDADRYYTNYKQAGGGTLAATLVGGGLIGLIPAIACSSTPPSESNLGYPDAQLFQNSSYYQGYTVQAKKIKSKKVWTNFGIGVAVNVGVLLLLTSAAAQ